MVYLYAVSASLLVLFGISFAAERRRLRNGIFLTLGLLLLGITVFVDILVSVDGLLEAVDGFLSVVMLVFTPILLFALGTACIENGRILLSKEGRKLPNLLTLGIGVGLIAFLLLTLVSASEASIQPVVTLLWLLVGYFSFLLVCYLVSSILYNCYQPKLDQDFILVLGSGLIGGRVPPLLAGRLERAISFYYKQNKVHTPPRIVVSGGQGSDEQRAEAVAMKQYLLERGIPDAQILVEAESANTLENMAYSKKIMDAAQRPAKGIFVTSNFHLFRAGIYARKAGIRANGLGARTAFYYLPNAFIREYLAVLALHKRVHFIVTLMVVLIAVSLAFRNGS
ncbi:YdcF family protein [Paenibacillus donghaensis]|nr:YdcF family protein [Paenibacillus donghaensis]